MISATRYKPEEIVSKFRQVKGLKERYIDIAVHSAPIQAQTDGLSGSP